MNGAEHTPNGVAANGIPDGTAAADLVLLDLEKKFWMKGAEEPILVPRMASFVVGEKKFGVGTDGLQILEARAWWDASVLKEEFAKRKSKY